MRTFLAVLAAFLLAGPAFAASRPFLDGQLVPGPTPGALSVLSYAGGHGSAAYDGGLAALWLLNEGRRDEAGRLLAGLAQVQQNDGGLPFSYPVGPGAGPPPAYVRVGAMAWVGYAAARYLDAAPDGPARVAISALAHKIAGYLLARQVRTPGDGREGLITGGSGRYSYTVGPRGVTETLLPGEITWVSSEHNIDAYFFFTAWGRVSGVARYTAASQVIATAVRSRLWDEGAGQFVQGFGDGPDRTAALDCASWGALFLLAVGDRPRAERAYQTAERRYADHDPTTGARGHRPYTGRPVIENRALAAYFAPQVPLNDWDRFGAVWPEGSAGVALAAARLGRTPRAREILAGLAPLRSPAGGLPALSRAVPMEFSTQPSLAGSAWAALVAAELAQPGKPGWIWGLPGSP